MKIGTIEISKLYIGSTEVTKAYMGTDIVYMLSAEYQEGYTAGYNDFINETTTTNPYTSGTQQYQDWQNGYTDGATAAQPVVYQSGYTAGYNDFIDETSTSNPYTQGTTAYTKWDEGYTAGQTAAEHVVYQEGYDAGYGDAESGTTTTNPYTQGTTAYTKWDEGYTDGYNAYIPTNAYIQMPNSGNFNESAYFVTDLYLKNTYNIEVKFKTSSNSRQWRQIFGSYKDNIQGHGGLGIQENMSSDYLVYTYWSYGTNTRIHNDTALPISRNTLYTLVTNVGTGNTTLNGTSYLGQGNNATGTMDIPFQFGCVKMENPDPGFDGKIYYIKVTDENNNVVAYYQANNSNNIPGFLDLISGTKYTNQHNTTISYGED